MSNFTEEGIMEVKSTACKALLEKRVESKLRNSKKVSEVLNRLSVTLPKPRDGKARDITIPDSVVAARASGLVKGAAATATSGITPAGAVKGGAAAAAGGAGADGDMEEEEGAGPAMVRRWLERDRERVGGGPGVYKPDTTRYYLLKDAEWKTDMIPEVMDGKNIADYVDPDVEERLLALEAEEEAFIQEQADGEAASEEDEEEAAEEKVKDAILAKMREKKALLQAKSHREKSKSRPPVPRTAAGAGPSGEEAKEHLLKLGFDKGTVKKVLSRTGKTAAAATLDDDEEEEEDGMQEEGRMSGKKRGRGRSPGPARGGAGGGDSDDEMQEEKGRSKSRARSSSAGPSMEHSGKGNKRLRSLSRGAALAGKVGAEAAFDKSGKPRIFLQGSARDPATDAPKARAEGLKSEAQKDKLRKLKKKLQERKFTGKGGESDRRIGTKMPKHLFSGKRGIGSTDWR